MWASHSGAPWEPTLGLLSFKNWANLCGSLCLIKPMPPAVEGQVLNHHQGGSLSFVVLYILFWGGPSWLAHGGKTVHSLWATLRALPGRENEIFGPHLCDLCGTTTAVCVCVCQHLHWPLRHLCWIMRICFLPPWFSWDTAFDNSLLNFFTFQVIYSVFALEIFYCHLG